MKINIFREFNPIEITLRDIQNRLIFICLHLLNN
jgi:hypothetical protein